MSNPSFDPPPGLNLHGDSIHTSADPKPHVTGHFAGGQTQHFNYTGQTTLGMFDQGLRDSGVAHRLNEVGNLAQQFPTVFRDSGVNW